MLSLITHLAISIADLIVPWWGTQIVGIALLEHPFEAAYMIRDRECDSRTELSRWLCKDGRI